jgi:arginine decarboxylase
MLAAFSQASMIHVQDGGARQLDRDRFNEAFMMHISTSPQYSIIASLDVASAMMEGPAGRSLLQETFDEALSFRRALANLRQHIAADDWWFSIWQPPGVEGIDRVQTEDWLLQPDADWHGFGEVSDDYVLLDPIKVTLVMPGLNAGGALSEKGIPAAVVSKFPLGAWTGRRENRLVFVSGAVFHGYHQGQMEHAAHRVAGVQAQLRRQRAS